jgi:hypothetical protein
MYRDGARAKRERAFDTNLDEIAAGKFPAEFAGQLLAPGALRSLVGWVLILDWGFTNGVLPFFIENGTKRLSTFPFRDIYLLSGNEAQRGSIIPNESYHSISMETTKMFTDKDFQILLTPAADEAKLVMIKIDDENGFLAVAKPFGKGKAACIVFAPATKLARPFDGFRPQFLRKSVADSDFALRTGVWAAVSLDNGHATALRQAATKALSACEKADPATMEMINMDRPANTSSAPDLSTITFHAPENTPLERALVHLMGWEPAKAESHAQQGNGEAAA